MARVGVFRGGILAMAWAVIGVLGGHVLTYAILYPDGHVHDAVMAETGHGWTEVLWPAVLTALAVVTAVGLIGRHQRGSDRGVRFLVLATLQVGLFAGLELAERAGVGMTLETLPHHLLDHGLAAILLIGTLVQLLTAWLGSAVSRFIAAVAGRLRALRRPRRRQPARVAASSSSRPTARGARAHGIRAPPLLASPSVPIP
jgi:hypothetical protein